MDADATFYATGVVLTLWGLLEIPYGALNVVMALYSGKGLKAFSQDSGKYFDLLGQMTPRMVGMPLPISKGLLTLVGVAWSLGGAATVATVWIRSNALLQLLCTMYASAVSLMYWWPQIAQLYNGLGVPGANVQMLVLFQIPFGVSAICRAVALHDADERLILGYWAIAVGAGTLFITCTSVAFGATIRSDPKFAMLEAAMRMFNKVGGKNFKWPADSPEPIWLEGFGEPLGAYPGKATQVKSTEADEAGTAEADATTWATPVVPSTKVDEASPVVPSTTKVGVSADDDLSTQGTVLSRMPSKEAPEGEA
jgi:hypothetical protein